MISEHARFAYRSLDELRTDIDRLGLELPLSADTEILKSPLPLGRRTLPNRLCVLPMEGCDATPEGAPGELTYRRYKRFASGGAGLLWFEANAVAAEGRANPYQLFLTGRTVDDFGHLTSVADNAARSVYPDQPRFQPYKVLQLTHSGRYAKPDYDLGEAVIASPDPYLDPYLPAHHRVITDEELSELIPAYVNAAVLAKRAGFDAVDVKACHLYLLSELLGARTRSGMYGGSFENRTRLLLDIIDRIQDKTDGLDVTLRMNAYDALPYPYGFGVNENDPTLPDLTEPIALVQRLWEHGVRLLSISVGNPYYNPHVGRPYDVGFYTPRSHQLTDTARILGVTRAIQQAVPGMAVVCTGMSWLREYGANVAAGAVRDGWCSVAGFGRQSFAYPDFAKDIVLDGGMKREKCCLACSSCTTLMRGRHPAGCPIRDKEVYGPMLREVLANGKPDGSRIADHV